MRRVNGRVTWFSFDSTNTGFNGTIAMAHVLDVVLTLEPPVLPMFYRTIKPHHFLTAIPPDFT